MAVILGLASLLWIRSPVHTMWALQHQLPSALVVISGFLFDFALFLVPGLAVAKLIFHRRPQMNPIYLVAVIVTTGAGLGYVSFWAFFFSMPLGRMLSYVVYTVSLGNLLLTSRSRDTSKQIIKAVGAPFFYSALAGLTYLCFFFLFIDPLSSGVWSPKTSIATWYAGVRFFDQIHPGDNQIPLIFADRIYDRGPLRPFCCGDWLSSDRPPLQSGIVLLERPIHVIPKLELDYELLTAGLQCLWICGVWCLLRSLGASDLITRRLLAFLIFSGFLFLNSVYTWPKLLSAAFLFFVISIIIAIIRRNQPATALESVVAAACVGLTLLAHPGSVFSLCSIALLMLYFRRLFPVRHIGLSFATLCMLILPWSAYQKFVDPPGNRLLKTHLASVIPIDNRSTWQALRDSYRSLTFVQIIQFKWENVKFLAGHKPLDLFGLDCFNFRKGMLSEPRDKDERAALIQAAA